MSIESILVIGDPHSHPDYDNDRFELAGNVARARDVDHVVCMGDWFDFTSLCTGAKALEKEGKRVREEVEAGHDALRRFMSAWRGVPNRCRPSFHMTAGNHDARPEMLASNFPHLANSIAADRYAPFERAGWEVTPFLETLELLNILFCHYKPSGVQGRAMSSDSGSLLASKLAKKGHRSRVVGHSHLYGHYQEFVDGLPSDRIHGFSAGCWVHPLYSEGWATQTEPMWDRGLLELSVDTGMGRNRLVAHRWDTMESLR